MHRKSILSRIFWRQTEFVAWVTPFILIGLILAVSLTVHRALREKPSAPRANAAPLAPGYAAVSYGEIPDGARSVIPTRLIRLKHPSDRVSSTHTLVFDSTRWAEIWKQMAPKKPLPQVQFNTTSVLITFPRNGDTEPPLPIVYAVDHNTHIVLELSRYSFEKTEKDVGADIFLIPTQGAPIRTVDLRPGAGHASKPSPPKRRTPA